MMKSVWSTVDGGGGDGSKGLDVDPTDTFGTDLMRHHPVPASPITFFSISSVHPSIRTFNIRHSPSPLTSRQSTVTAPLHTLALSRRRNKLVIRIKCWVYESCILSTCE